jgi:hypothetical protein
MPSNSTPLRLSSRIRLNAYCRRNKSSNLVSSFSSAISRKIERPSVRNLVVERGRSSSTYLRASSIARRIMNALTPAFMKASAVRISIRSLKPRRIVPSSSSTWGRQSLSYCRSLILWPLSQRVIFLAGTCNSRPASAGVYTPIPMKFSLFIIGLSLRDRAQLSMSQSRTESLRPCLSANASRGSRCGGCDQKTALKPDTSGALSPRGLYWFWRSAPRDRKSFPRGLIDP